MLICCGRKINKVEIVIIAIAILLLFFGRILFYIQFINRHDSHLCTTC